MPLFPIRAIALMRRGNCRQSDTRYRQTPYSESTTIPTLILIAPCNPHDGLQQYNKHQVQACHIILGIENLANFGVKDKANASKNKKPTAAEICSVIDIISVSLNDPDSEKYDKITKNIYPGKAFDAMLQFTKDCVACGAQVWMTVVDVIPPENIEKSKKICEQCGANFRVRSYDRGR